MRSFRLSALLVLLVAATACGGGSGGDGVVGGGGGSTSLTGSFAPDPLNPGGPLVVGLIQGPGSGAGGLVNVQVRVEQTDDVFGASFDLLYDTSFAQYVSWSPGQLLESGGAGVSYQISVPQPGRVVVGASRNGGSGGVDVGSPVPVISVTFRMIRAGASDLGFANTALLDSQATPQPLAGLSWFGGTMIAN